MLRMRINQEEITNPIKCTACEKEASMLFFELLKPNPELGITAAYRKLYAKCGNCLTLVEIQRELVDD